MGAKKQVVFASKQPFSATYISVCAAETHVSIAKQSVNEAEIDVFATK